jgi:sugar-specific transcriptional regulator TrmB
MFKKTTSQEMAAGWYKREEKAVKEVEKILREADLSMDVVTAVALRSSLDDVERIERMIISAEARRNAVLREVARYRAAFAEDLRRNSPNVRDAEFSEVGRP